MGEGRAERAPRPKEKGVPALLHGSDRNRHTGSATGENPHGSGTPAWNGCCRNAGSIPHERARECPFGLGVVLPSSAGDRPLGGVVYTAKTLESVSARTAGCGPRKGAAPSRRGPPPGTPSAPATRTRDAHM